jgi:predicted RNA-binding Zn ribbon-like protein
MDGPEFLVALVNSRALGGGATDRLADVASARAWLREHGGREAIGEPQRPRLVELREALRADWLAPGAAPRPGLADLLNRAAADLRPHFTVDGVALAERAGPDRVLARVADAAFWAVASGAWPRLKACQNDTCHEAFYDSTKNASRTWCSMSPCGNRMKARAYRERHA